MENSIVITSSELVEHTVLSRKLTEAKFRRDLLERKGANKDDMHVQGLVKQIAEIDARLKPLDEKLKRVELISLMPSRAEIIALTAEIEQNSRDKLEEAMRARNGPVYELLNKRAEYTRANYENREQIARLTVLANCLPRKEAEKMKALLESNANDVVDISSLSDEKKAELVTALGRIGMPAKLEESKLSVDKKKVDGIAQIVWDREISKHLVEKSESAYVFWVDKKNEQAWDENEKKISEISRKIQIMLAKSQGGALDDDGKMEFEGVQKQYIELKQKRAELASKNGELSVALPLLRRDEIKVYAP